MTTEYEREYRTDMIEESMTNGQYMSAAINQHVSIIGSEDEEAEFILTPFDTWERNPHFTGTPCGHHPEDY